MAWSKVRKERSPLTPRLSSLHLLKWKYQPAKRSNSWLYTIAEHRERIELAQSSRRRKLRRNFEDAIEDSPSLRNVYEEGFEKSYERARRGVAIETGMPINVFPERSPFNIEQVIDPNFLPQ